MLSHRRRIVLNGDWVIASSDRAGDRVGTGASRAGRRQRRGRLAAVEPVLGLDPVRAADLAGAATWINGSNGS